MKTDLITWQAVELLKCCWNTENLKELENTQISILTHTGKMCFLSDRILGQENGHLKQ